MRESKPMSPQAGEIAVSDSSLLRPGVSCATTGDERQSKMKCTLPDVNTANCQSPQGNQPSRRKERGEGKENVLISGNIGAAAETWENWGEVRSTSSPLSRGIAGARN